MENQISALLEAKGYTQDFLAQKTGISQSYISKLCNGKCVPTLDKAYLIATALNVPLEALINPINDCYASKYQFTLSQDEMVCIHKLRMLSLENQQAIYAVIDTYLKLKNGTQISSNFQENSNESTAM